MSRFYKERKCLLSALSELALMCLSVFRRHFFLQDSQIVAVWCRVYASEIIFHQSNKTKDKWRRKTGEKHEPKNFHPVKENWKMILKTVNNNCCTINAELYPLFLSKFKVFIILILVTKYIFYPSDSNKQIAVFSCSASLLLICELMLKKRQRFRSR